MRLRFQVPPQSPAPTLQDLLRRAWPEATTEQLLQAITSGQMEVDGLVEKRPDRTPAALSQVEGDVDRGEDVYGVPSVEELGRGGGWVLVDKPAGMPGHIDPLDPMDAVMFMADILGLDREGFAPVWPMPPTAAGAWLCATGPKAAQALGERLESGAIQTSWSAMIARPERPQGLWEGPGGMGVQFVMTRAQGNFCEVQLMVPSLGSTPPGGLFEALCETLARSGFPVIGDRTRGGLLVDGELRLRLCAIYATDGDAQLGQSWATPASWWPPVEALQAPAASPAFGQESPIRMAPGPAPPALAQVPNLHVSPKTLEIVGEGHPWVIEDAQTGKRDHLKPGALVRLSGPHGQTGPWALVEGRAKLAARIWSADADDVAHFAEEVDARVNDAIARRAPLLREIARTNLFRLIHGEADGLPGLLVDRVGQVLRATVTGHASHAFRQRVYENLVAHDPQVALLEAVHAQDVREAGELPRATLVYQHGSYLHPGPRVVALEDGLQYLCEPWEGIDTGFFADQRDNRRRMRALAAPGQRWLNLFCHTGSFSVVLTSRGASVVSVDLSRRYLNWLEENLVLNQIPAERNSSVAADCREYLAPCQEAFDGIIVDPPTAAAANGSFWSVRRDYEALLERAMTCLKPGGWMLVCRNDRKRTPSLGAMVRGVAERSGRVVQRVEDAPPALDYPVAAGFPEGDSFHGCWVQLGALRR